MMALHGKKKRERERVTAYEYIFNNSGIYEKTKKWQKKAKNDQNIVFVFF